MTPEQGALLRKARDSLRGARLLADNELPDFAVSRAYYAMFYVAEALLLGEGLAFSKHSAVISAFGQHFAKTGRVPQELHRYLLDGQDGRQTGDHSIWPALSRNEAASQIARAERFLEAAEDVLGPVPDD